VSWLAPTPRTLSTVDRGVRQLVLWDIDRTLLYVGEIDRQVYREAFAELVGREPAALPAKGAGRTVPLATREMFLINGVPESQAAELTTRALEFLPRRFAQYRDRLAREGRPGSGVSRPLPIMLPTCGPAGAPGGIRAPNLLIRRLGKRG
jgi:phosphoglycolate phosphatase-like HAD superfamily hydrolase